MDVAQLLWTAVTDHLYASLGLLVLVEGPAATVFGGSLVGAGFVVFWPIMLIVVVAEVTADSGLYLLGRLGARPRVARLLRRLGLTAVRHERLTAMINDDLPRVVAGAKAVDLAAIPAFLAAGLARVPYRRFVSWTAPASTVRAVLLLAVGAVFGHSVAGLFDFPVVVLALAIALAVTVGLANRLVRRRTGRRFRLTS
ncbi:DedA family protein [Glycomyces xiaoerkulensis]|uniref:DedA family protein n=1 Tax=Glycomyces xiaoerkulensis TaxID=2038139 RepID=UPI000C25B142|nr:VTT domain-containing protein [Glycomyces xiaoerkulensis]